MAIANDWEDVCLLRCVGSAICLAFSETGATEAFDDQRCLILLNSAVSKEFYHLEAILG